jgi:tetratricopeptide (TPR) repeat protein
MAGVHAFLDPHHYGPLFVRAEIAPPPVRTRMLDATHAAAEEEVRGGRLDRAGDVYAFLAHTDSSAARLESVFASLQRMLEVEPAHPEALYQTGKIGAMTGAHLDVAERALRTYAEHAGGDRMDGAHYRLGQIAQHRGDVAAARREYQAALALNPAFTDARTALEALDGEPPP